MTTLPFLAPAALLAWLVARRAPSPRQRAIAEALTGLLAVNVARLVLPLGSPPDVAAFALWYAVSAGAVWSVLAKDETRRARMQYRNAAGLASPPVLLEVGRRRILLAAVGLASPIAYRCGIDVARVAFALSLTAQAVATLRFLSRGRWPDDAQRVALILAASSLADLAGPWRVGSPGDLWYVANVTSALTWLAICGWEIRCLTRARR